MGRRKQQKPRPGLGPVEQRLQAQQDEDEARHDEAWLLDGEGGEPAGPSRPRKRPRPSPAKQAKDQGTLAVEMPSQLDQLWLLGSVGVELLGSSAQVQQAETLHFSFQPAPEDDEEDEDEVAGVPVMLEAAGPLGSAKGTLKLPSAEVAGALRAMLARGLGAVTLEPAAAADPACGSAAAAAAAGTAGMGSAGAGSAAPVESGASSGTHFWLHLWLTEKAFEGEPTSPEEAPRRKGWQGAKPLLLGWLRPELDPEGDPPICHRQQERQQQQEQEGTEAIAQQGGAATPLHSLPTSPRSPLKSPLKSPLSPRGGHAGAFDAAELYAAVKPTGREPELTAATRELRPTLRRYQRRAAQWMVTRELGSGSSSDGSSTATAAAEGSAAALHPLWREVRRPPGPGAPQGGHPGPFYLNPYSGALCRQRFEAPPLVRGGILCDEMGLGKTVELLACIVAHRYTGPPPQFPTAIRKRRRRERIECVCGCDDADPDAEEGYQGLWLQCDGCDAWMHGACVGYTRAPPAGQFVCAACQRAKAEADVTQDCGATLIVCPMPILQQWRSEIARHIQPGALKVVVYSGQAQPGPGGASRHQLVTAADLAAADIVLTTYDVLKRDVYHQPQGEAGEQRSLRHRKKYEVIPTPLTRLRWWRVCLDEAQMVESTTAKAAEMALLLPTRHRWCVTGTPLSRGLEDIHGLLAFLKASPWDDLGWWRRAIQVPYEAGSRAARARLFLLLRPSQGGLMWRSAKADVADELDLPPQHHNLVNLQLSAIERHFYTRQHQDCVGKARAALPSGVLAVVSASIVDSSSAGDGEVVEVAAGGAPEVVDRALTPQEERKLLDPLLRLRQACCHPQVGGGGIKSLAGGHQRSPMSMDEILEVLIAKARTEAEEAQRVLLAALNGIAGLLILQQQIPQAVDTYREALAQVERNRGAVRADKLQQLHTLHNLAELLGLGRSGVAAGAGGAAGAGPGSSGQGAGVAPTLREATLIQQAQELRDDYMAEPISKLAAAQHDMEEVEAHVERCRVQPLPGGHGLKPAEAAELVGSWWVDAVLLMTGNAHDHGRHIADLIQGQLKEATMYLRPMSQNAASFGGRFRDLWGLEVLLKQEMQELERAQRAALEGLKGITREVASPSQQLVEQAAQCGRCRAETGIPGRVCRHCRLEESFLRWEGRLFSLYAKAGAGAGGQVTAEEALAKAHQTTLNRVGRGGLGEAAGPSGDPLGAPLAAEEGAGMLLLGAQEHHPSSRRDAAVALTEIVRKPSEAETALRLLLHQLRLLRLPPNLAERKELLAAAGKAHLEGLEAARKLYLKARALTLAQRAKLYALDELDMATMRLRLRAPGEVVREGEELFKLHEAEIPVKSTELSGDKAVAEAELRRTLGTLRYLQGLKAERQRAAAAAAAAAADAAGTAEGDAAGEGAQLDRHAAPQQQQEQQQQQQGGGGTANGAGPSTASPAPGWGILHPPRTAAGVAAEARAAAAAAAAAGASADANPAAPPATAAIAPRQPVLGSPGAAQQQERVEDDVCPVCQEALGAELSMLPCGHRLCCRCSVVLVERLPAAQPQATKRIQCPTCRARVPVGEIAYVDSRAPPKQQQGAEEGAGGAGEAAIQVRGSYGTKLENVVRWVLWLSRQDPSAKFLVFSSWKDVLSLVSHALTANGVAHLHPKDSKHFDAAIAQFKQQQQEAQQQQEQQLGGVQGRAGRVVAGGAKGAAAAAAPANVLLLLVKQGGNGLNLTEAQHVLLVEPLLDPGVEAQAVGRVHRIGQTKPTFVHRFVVEGTIEENVHRLAQQRQASMDLSAAVVKRQAGSKERGGLTIRDVALLLREGSSMPEAGVRHEGEEVAAADLL